MNNFSILTITLGIYLIFIGVLYYIIYNKHHKRNKIELFELISLLAKFFSITTITIIIIILGVKCFVLANEYKDSRIDVITHLSLGIFIISIDIINYISYIKRSLKDFDIESRESSKKSVIRIGEVLELIIFTIMLFMPIWRIPYFIQIFVDKRKLLIEILKAFGICIVSIILLFNLNPLNFKEKLTKNKRKIEKNKENIDYNEKKY